MTVQEDVARMRRVLEMSDEELTKAGYTTPRSVLMDDLKCGVFHAISRFGYECCYTHDVEATCKAYDQLTYQYELRRQDAELNKKAAEHEAELLFGGVMA